MKVCTTFSKTAQVYGSKLMGPLDENMVCLHLCSPLPHSIEHLHQQIGHRVSTWGSNPMVHVSYCSKLLTVH
jgi:hypothetical protein